MGAEDVVNYWQRKAEHLAAKLDDARREIERLTAERDALGRDMERMTATASDAAKRLRELRALAETAMRAPTDTERQLAASVVCARLCRPPASPVSAAADALATCRAGANEVDHG